MRKRSSNRACPLVLLTLLAVGCARMAAPGLVPRLSEPDDGWVRRTLRKMTIEEKVGQLISCRFSGAFRNLDSEERRSLEDLVVKAKIGGLILFGGEVYETAELLNAIQRKARVPLLIASDLERGAGNQITGATLFPPLMSLGAAGSEELAYEMGRITALEGRAVGIHMTYAPVVDVNVNPDNPIINTRAIGADPALVSRIASAFIRGCQAGGMLATAKHFPGHGDTSEDSHSLLPTITADRERLERVELAPFKAAVDAGVKAIMTAHLHVPALDPTPGLPATLSAPILTGILRERFGFQGLIVTDALEMAGVTAAFSSGEAAERALMAGADQLLLPLETDKAIAHLVEAVRGGRVPMARLDEAVRRILEAKASLGLHKERIVRTEELARRIATRPFLEQAAKTFESSVTLVKNEGDILPLDGSRGPLVILSLSSDLGDYFAGRAFVAAMRKRFPAAAAFYADGDTGEESLRQAEEAAGKAGTVVCALFSRLSAGKGSTDLEPRHVDLINRLVALEPGPAVVAISFGSPYFLRRLPGVEAYLCLYRNTPETQAIAARALVGEMDIGGRLPVSIPDLFPMGHGLTLKRRAPGP